MVLCLIVVVPASAHSGAFFGKKDGLEEIFPKAEVIESKPFFLRPEQAAEVKRLSGAEMKDRLVTVYIGKRAEEIIGYAFIETHLVRTMPETLLVRISPEGVVERLLLLAFYEPRDYLPSDTWLDQFRGERLDADLRVRRDIQGIGGATLTAHAVTRGVRKSAALFEVIFKKVSTKD